MCKKLSNLRREKSQKNWSLRGVIRDHTEAISIIQWLRLGDCVICWRSLDDGERRARPNHSITVTLRDKNIVGQQNSEGRPTNLLFQRVVNIAAS